ncbi:hypothetical protein H5185_12095 [Shewanella sp. SG44-6]|jgi:hypothetical protein|uniref:hypothetical protein n=1 Tax=Shewanella sp. SG44-6 TaxID=2760959 RepID=UPI0016042F6B|nr:hypothetical protein [Shewanella sp. SG44-6]MBB1390154.1 hypothetical protein [Shewanella sp. SG44-6]
MSGSETTKKLPKRVNGEIKLGVIHLVTVKLIAVIMVFGIYLSHFNIAMITSIVVGLWMEKMIQRYGRGIVKHFFWHWGVWVVDDKYQIPSPAIKKYFK